MDGVTQTFLEHGVLGAVTVVLLIAVGYLYKSLQKAQAARIEDQKKVTATLLEANERWHEVIDDLSDAIAKKRGDP